MNAINLRRISFQNYYLFALLLLIVVLAINFALQTNLFQLNVLNRNLRVFFPAMVLAAGQAIVVIGGGIDLSVGMLVSLINALLVTWITPDSTTNQIVLAVLLACGVGMLAGALNGFCVAYLRLQPIVTTYATGFIFSGVALLILPRPGGQFPDAMQQLYRATPLGIPFTLYLIVVIAILWFLLRSTRFGQFLFATGGQADAAYATGIPVNRVRLTTYVLSGLCAALAALALTMSVGTGDPHIGDAMTLPSVVAVVLGGTRLSGGRGGVIGTLIGVLILGTINNIISFASIDNWSQTLVRAGIIILALAGPGLLSLLRRGIPASLSWFRETQRLRRLNA